jgi:hypothetical protein
VSTAGKPSGAPAPTSKPATPTPKPATPAAAPVRKEETPIDTSNLSPQAQAALAVNTPQCFIKVKHQSSFQDRH